MRKRICVLCMSLMAFVTPLMGTVANTPHPDHPGHIHGLT